jgi:hypothetical protein
MSQSEAIQQLLAILAEAEHEANDVLRETVADARNMAMAKTMTMTMREELRFVESQ